MKIIFVEGVSGVGKSTAVCNLGNALLELGCSVKCHYEGDCNSPLDLCWVAYITPQEYQRLLNSFPADVDKMSQNTIYIGEYVLIRYQIGRTPLYCSELHNILHSCEFCYNPHNTMPILKFTEVFLMLWKSFADSNSTCDYEIFDASLVSHMTNDLTRNYHASENEIATHLNTLLATVSRYNPMIFYLHSDNVRERLIKARESRKQPPVDEGRLCFWERRKELDLVVLPKLLANVIMCDISKDNWNDVTKKMVDESINKISNDFTDITSKTEAERLGKLYPIILTEHNTEYVQAYITERDYFLGVLGDSVLRISHIGSTAVPGLIAKPTVDILLEIKENSDLTPITKRLQNEGYVVNTPPMDIITYLKGYGPNGFIGQAFHVHVRNVGDYGELYFRDYLIVNPEVAKQYGTLKLGLKDKYEFDRDGYTAAKGEFIERITALARTELKDKYKPIVE